MLQLKRKVCRRQDLSKKFANKLPGGCFFKQHEYQSQSLLNRYSSYLIVYSYFMLRDRAQ